MDIDADELAKIIDLTIEAIDKSKLGPCLLKLDEKVPFGITVICGNIIQGVIDKYLMAKVGFKFEMREPPENWKGEE